MDNPIEAADGQRDDHVGPDLKFDLNELLKGPVVGSTNLVGNRMTS